MTRLDGAIRKAALAGTETLLYICKNGERDADRIAAARALVEYGMKRAEAERNAKSERNAEGGEPLRVVLENVPGEYTV